MITMFDRGQLSKTMLIARIALVSIISHLIFHNKFSSCSSINSIELQQQDTLTTIKVDDLPISSAFAPSIRQLTTNNQQDGANQRPVDWRRPVWNLAHMVNSIKELDYRLEKGANAVEADVTFGSEGDPLFTYHGPPCDCWRHCHQQEDFNEYLNYVREIAIEEVGGIGKNLTLLFLDLKLDYLDQRGKARAGIELAKSIVNHLFVDSSDSNFMQATPTEIMMRLNSDGHQSNATQRIAKNTNNSNTNKLRLILSVNHVTDVELINNFLHFMDINNSSHLMERIGFDVGMNDDLQQIEFMWKRFGNTLNLWQGDGYTNCFSPFYNLERLSKALLKRDSETGYPKKVYQWTIDLHDRMREALRMGVDAVMTNHPERLVAVLREPELAHNFRLANREDDPFKKITQRASARSSESARFQRSASPQSGGMFASFMDVITSWFAYIKEIPFLSLPTTSRFMPKVKRSKSQQQVLAPTPPPTDDKLEYRVDKAATSNSKQTISPIGGEQISDKVKDEQSDYDGPKWYTSLISNLLVTAMKIMMPA